MRKGMTYFGWVLLLFWTVPVEAHAYLDPGTGGAILQGVLAAVGAAIVALKLYWHKILRVLGLRPSAAPEK